MRVRTYLLWVRRISVRNEKNEFRIARKLSKLEPKVQLRNFPSVEEIQDESHPLCIRQNGLLPCSALLYGCIFLSSLIISEKSVLKIYSVRCAFSFSMACKSAFMSMILIGTVSFVLPCCTQSLSFDSSPTQT